MISPSRKQAEEQARRFRILVYSVRDYGIFILSPEGNVATWNLGAERLKGYQAADIIGRHFSAFYPPEDIAAGKCEYELRTSDRGRSLRRRGLALTQGREPVLGKRDHHGAAGR